LEISVFFLEIERGQPQRVGCPPLVVGFMYSEITW
jgi:hypothetical protein